MSKLTDQIREMQEVTEKVADQSVYAYRGSVMIGHFTPSTRWVLVEEPAGMGCQVWSMGTDGNFKMVKELRPGEWTFIGRGHPGQ